MQQMDFNWEYDSLEKDLNSSIPKNHLASLSPTAITISTVLGVLIFCTLVGNVFVIYAILADRVLHRVGNYLILSLAIADSLVACSVMPISLFYDVIGEWQLGPTLCEVWISADVLLCTASILHLLAIALDRYFAVTNVDYIHSRDGKLIFEMIIAVWLAAIVISFAPIMGWKDPNFLNRIESEKTCLVSQDIAYQIFATCSSFYAPLVVILFLYWRIYKVAKRRIRRKPGSNTTSIVTQNPEQRDIESDGNTLSIADQSNEDSCRVKKTADREASIDTDGKRSTSSSFKGSISLKFEGSNGACRAISVSLMKESLEAKRERKAAKTLAIITGAFVVCWLPFFIIALVRPICGNACNPSKIFQSVASWLGFTNSTLNPIIYTIFSPEFRAAFQRILCRNKSPSRHPCYV
ncbi:5-hydroxytryptamine receptor-like [Brevipalpus obovatus]|uniref:5-hydroxytryptamine receptor-like n=1 Tax=Brevipalpus obovatus TaxID=246614 RepID=UPI003D9EF88C